jgi:hypothetical protein
MLSKLLDQGYPGFAEFTLLRSFGESAMKMIQSSTLSITTPKGLD